MSHLLKCVLRHLSVVWLVMMLLTIPSQHTLLHTPSAQPLNAPSNTTSTTYRSFYHKLYTFSGIFQMACDDALLHSPRRKIQSGLAPSQIPRQL